MRVVRNAKRKCEGAMSRTWRGVAGLIPGEAGFFENSVFAEDQMQNEACESDRRDSLTLVSGERSLPAC